MDPIPHEKKLEVCQQYILGYTYSEIEKKTGVSHGSIVNYIKELEAGQLVIPGVATDEVHDLHQLSIYLAKKNHEPSKALLGIALFEKFTELGIDLSKMEQWAKLVQVFSPKDFPAKEFFEAALKLHQLEVTEGKPFEVLAGEYAGMKQQSGDLKIEVGSLSQQKDDLDNKTKSLTTELDKLENTKKEINASIELQSQKLEETNDKVDVAQKTLNQTEQDVEILEKQKSLLTGEIKELENRKAVLIGEISGAAAAGAEQIRVASQEIVTAVKQEGDAINKEFKTILEDILAAGEAVGEMKVLQNKSEESGKELEKIVGEVKLRIGETK
jgi:predicted  nucleic acid-binding Zn-ribbon protein